jgi:DNA repair exonuclease SbcCD ATPase subunit
MEYRELRASLQTLSDQSLKTSRHLDDTYYGILEKISILRQTIGSLQELSGLTKELHENFQSDTKELSEEVRGQFEGFNKFEEQEDQVRGFEERIKGGQEKANILTERLAEARRRVDERVKMEKEREERFTRMLPILYT